MVLAMPESNLLVNRGVWLPLAALHCCAAGDANMRFYNVRDLRAAGVYVQSYKGPGLEVSWRTAIGRCDSSTAVG